MNLKEIKEIINLMNENNLSEIEVEKDGLKIKLKKTPEHGTEIITEKFSQAPVGEVTQREKLKEPAETATERRLIEVKAPIVGTFYRSPSPEADSFVEVGQEIEVGQVVCIIEAMKLMNEIKSEVRGKIIDILAENADPVEYGQILLLIEPI